MEPCPIVFVIDDDPLAREAIAAMLRQQAVAVESFASAEEFLSSFDRSRLGCLVLDPRTAGITGAELQSRLRAAGVCLPVIMVTTFTDMPAAVSYFRGGEITFLEKPCTAEELWESVRLTLERHNSQRRHQARRAELQARFAQLTDGERQVLELLVAGKTNKAVAAELGLGPRTVEQRRANLFKKLQVATLAELVRVYLELHAENNGTPPPPRPPNG
jgi:RNA polymerase sigma factor (sigma-70 family)